MHNHFRSYRITRLFCAWSVVVIVAIQTSNQSAVVAGDAVYDNSFRDPLPNGQGHYILPGQGEEGWAQAFNLRDHNTVSSVTVFLDRQNSVDGVVDVSIWDEADGEPGAIVASIGQIDVGMLPDNGLNPIPSLERLEFETSVAGLSPNSTYFVVLNTEGVTGVDPQAPANLEDMNTLLVPVPFGSSGTNGASEVFWRVPQFENEPWTESRDTPFGGPRYLQMKVEATFNQTIDYTTARWTTPVPVPGINDTFEGSPSITGDGLTMYFFSPRELEALELGDRTSGLIWTATRPSIDAPFENPQPLELPSIIPGVSEVEPDVTGDDLELYFIRDTFPLDQGPAETPDDTVWVAKRESADAPWGEPTKLSDAVHSLGCVSDPSVTADGLELYLDIGVGGCGAQTQKIHVARRSSRSEPFGVPEKVSDGLLPAISADGLNLFHRKSSDLSLHVSSRDSRDEPFGPAHRLGSPPNNETRPHNEQNSFYAADVSGDGRTMYLTSMKDTGIHNPDWPFGNVVDGIWQSSIAESCDLNADGMCDVADLDLLNREVRTGQRDDDYFDLNIDGTLDDADRSVWVHQMANTFFGDANLDGEFNSSDLTLVFTANEYEDRTPLNSTWAEGDWNGDGDFDSGDLVAAFKDGGYEQGPRVAATAVPEPNSRILAVIGLSVLKLISSFTRQPNGSKVS